MAIQKKTVTLALQGGGSHGAFTWGVLDRLLEDDRIEFEGITGASAGAMNAVALAYGYAIGGRDGARQSLKNFWNSVATKAPFNLAPDDSYTRETIGMQSHPPVALHAFLSLTRFFSPYQLNPFDINPLRDILETNIDFERLKSDGRIRLFIAATHVRTGALKLFRNKQITLDTLLASACLPAINRAVEIDGEAYWDGGFTANPPIFPLLHQCTAKDMMVVLLDSHPRPAIPATADEICARLTDIGFSSALSTELQGLALAQREARRGMFAFGRMERRLRNLNIHLIEAQDFMSRLSGRSKLNTHSPFINALRNEGRNQAELWLAKNFVNIGARSSFNLAQFLR